jgi:hypothetical protein
MIGAGGLVSVFVTTYNMLKFSFPEIEWKPKKFTLKAKKSVQRFLLFFSALLILRWLFVVANTMFHNTTVFEEHLHSDLSWGNQFVISNANFADGQRKVQLDVWIPENKLAFEYQGAIPFKLGFNCEGEQHYHPLGEHGSLDAYLKRDKEKRRQCKDLGITLVLVPYWWDGTIASLSGLLEE